MRLRLSRIHHPVSALGPGERVGVWFQGCDIGCEGCASRDTWDAEGGFSVSVADVVAVVDDAVRADGAVGVTLSGGEPFQQPAALLGLLGALRRLPSVADGQCDILCFTGYPMLHLRRHFSEHLALLDAVVAGPYVLGRPAEHPLLASDNQRLEILTPGFRDRYAVHAHERAQLQIAGQGRQLFLVGLPDPGDLERFRDRMGEAGIDLEDVSWMP